jgi:hypothetical protein
LENLTNDLSEILIGNPTTKLGVRMSLENLLVELGGELPDPIEIAIGMKVMICFNLSTGADIAKGARGSIRDVILDPREEAMENENGSVKLECPP